MTALSLSGAFVVGALLSLSGATLQSVLRNPLAEPYVLGLTGGASLFVAAAFHFGWTALGAFTLPASAFAGSCLSLAVVCAVAAAANRRRSRAEREARQRLGQSTVVLAGFMTGSFACSLQMLLLSQARDATFAAHSKWLFGSLAGVTGGSLACGACVLAASLAALLAQAHRLDVLSLGADRAECLGVDTRRLKFVALGVASAATATAVAMAGAIGFVGLVAPHAARRLLPGRHRVFLPLSAATGGAALVAAAAVGAALPGELSPGVVCALVGAPCFALLLLRR